MKQLTGFIPIAVLPESTAASAKQQLIETIEWLYKEGAASETNLKHAYESLNIQLSLFDLTQYTVADNRISKRYGKSS
ncbi:hypothetical protein [Nostoc sp. UHCC 0251]|uniref:hypothetical protein n=1 Tax=Nostoc sp. UHCC 0251 TaxID=3110240 RepID=UPI002B20967A|nr:hypothetical protein [Nostoc sp. UHCC 0251]MEA5624776.1 hypothetical protein [Nostoc sp. UHCC 0251]